MRALQKPKDTPIQKAAAPPAQASDYGVAFGKNAVRVVPSVGQKGECKVTRKVCKCNALLKGKRLANSIKSNNCQL